MKKRLSYRKAKYKTAEQYGISINKKMIEDMGIIFIMINLKIK